MLLQYFRVYVTGPVTEFGFSHNVSVIASVLQAFVDLEMPSCLLGISIQYYYYFDLPGLHDFILIGDAIIQRFCRCLMHGYSAAAFFVLAIATLNDGIAPPGAETVGT